MLAVVFGTLFVPLGVRAQAGGGFDLSWSSIVSSGGGPSSVGTGLELQGSVVRGAAGRSQGGGTTLTGGFWVVPSWATIGVSWGDGAIPSTCALLPIGPNPVADRAVIQFRLSTARRARLELYSIGGQRVRVLVDAPLSPGGQRAVWDARDDSGRRVPDGIYFARVVAGDFSASTRIVVIH